MKEINLEEILEDKLKFQSIRHKQTEENALLAMKEACRQVLELAAENTGFIETTSKKLNSEEYKPFITANDNTIWTIDKQSILNTINQVI